MYNNVQYKYLMRANINDFLPFLSRAAANLCLHCTFWVIQLP